MRRLTLAALALMIALPASAGIYKWTDAAGNVHYGSQPPPGQGKEMAVPKAATPATPPVAAPARPDPGAAPESDILRQMRELEERKRAESRARLNRDYEAMQKRLGDQPDYICAGAENRLASAKEQWQGLRQQGYTISDETYYTQRIKDLQRERDNLCR